MPAKGKTRVTKAQRRTIVAGKLAGKTGRALAIETNLNQTTVSKVWHQPQSVPIAQRLLAGSESRLVEMWAIFLGTLNKDLKSAHPDIRRNARTDFLKTLTVGQPKAVPIAPQNQQGDFTFEQLLITMREASGGLH